MPEPSTQAEIARLLRYADNETDKLRDALRRLDEQASACDRYREALEAALWLAEDAHPEEARAIRARFPDA